MKKADKQRLDESLSKALAPRRPRRNLDTILDEYAETSSTLPSQTSTTSQTSIAPVRDFTRVANSIHRRAVPAGIFTGKSKQLYDCLYSLTRGAIKPSRSVRVSRPKLMKLAHIGARTTFDTNVERLVAAGLLQVRKIAGEHEGNEYTVFTPDEVSLPSQSSHTSQSSPAQNVDGLDSLESSQTSHTVSADFQRTSEIPKTSFKTTTKTDDELTPLRDLERELKAPPGDWQPVLQLVADEIRRAASNTPRVSNPAAFATAHLTGVFAPKSRPERPVARVEPVSTPPAEIEPPDPETAAEYERIRAELAGN